MKNTGYVKLKLAVLVCFILGFSNCKDRGEKLSPVADSEDTRIHSTTFDGCEYIFFTYADGSMSSLTHKGNCGNPQHQQ